MPPPKKHKHDIPDKKSVYPQQPCQPHSEPKMDEMIQQSGGAEPPKKAIVPNTSSRRR